MHIKLHGLSHDGRAVGRGEDGKVVFVYGALPGQTVDVEIQNAKKNFAEGKLIQIVEQCAEARPAPCPHDGECGGCPWQTLPYEAQCRWKKQLVVDALERIGKCNMSTVQLRDIIPSPQEWHCRNKMEFAFDAQGRLGLRKRDSHEIVEVTGCLMQGPVTMEILTITRSMASSLVTPLFLNVRCNLAGNIQVEFVSNPSPQARELGEALMAVPGVTGFVHSIKKSPSPSAYGEKLLFSLGAGLEETLHVQGKNFTFALGHDSFFQVNSLAAQALYSAASEMAQAGAQDDLWDVYCGIGGLALTAGAKAKTVLGLENVSSAVKLARANAARNDITQASFEVATAEYLGKYFKQMGAPAILMADPPRSGMAEAATHAILKYRPGRLVLVSCNPATLARDIAALRPAYALRTLQPVDLFPQTPHIETVALLEKI